MDYQKVACWGDSQTYGARTYGCYPLYLAQRLDRETRYTWRALTFATNGHTARDLWFRLGPELMSCHDVYTACVLIGANDVGRGTPLDVFEEYLRQSLQAFAVHGMPALFVGEIPPVFPDGHAFFGADTAARRDDYNDVLVKVVADVPHAELVTFPELTADGYTDPVHFNEAGNHVVADAFADAIRRR